MSALPIQVNCLETIGWNGISGSTRMPRIEAHSVRQTGSQEAYQTKKHSAMSGPASPQPIRTLPPASAGETGFLKEMLGG